MADYSAQLDRLYGLGFRPDFSVERLSVPLVASGETYFVKAKLTVYPERGEARRFFGRVGPAVAEVHGNVPFEAFEAEKRHGNTDLRDVYREKCASQLVSMLEANEPLLAPKAAA
jgi:hypothetical protein